jgi:cellulose synthase (UDP-forming)
MSWLDSFYSPSVAIPFSLILVALISLLSWRKKGQQILLALTLLLYARYLLWRGVYTLNTGDWASLLVSLTVYTAELYAFVQVALFAYHAWSPLDRKPVALRTFPTVDIFVTVVDEPLSILRRTLIGCINQDYPKDKYRVYVLDDGQRDEAKVLAAALGCGYIRRASRAHAKAGNLNHALPQTAGQFIAIFDVDHVPTSRFLKDTIGFFQDDKVAFVQTPHHFYNADIFQKNLQLEGTLKNEQALFYRVLQAGRDSHNSAFFAGSCGVFRRRVLEEIGGFRTETVTEDIHTSMVIHARGYRSCYLNKVLAAGLMPETFESTMKQRIRWAMGHVQILFQSNPLTMRGLTVPQRIGYFASILYFLHGIPRVVCIVAPLCALLLGIIPVTADVSSIVLFFGSYYLATLVMLRTVSRGSRNAFWSDIYETADCVALSWATLKTAIKPWKARPFVITPKGTKQERRGFSRFAHILPHLTLFGLLVAGLVTGIRLWMKHVPLPGLEVSLFWGTVNLVLVGVAILAASDLQEWRQVFRIRHRLPCEVVAGSVNVGGMVADINETGALVHLNQPLLVRQDPVLFSLQTHIGDRLTVKAKICRQERISADRVQVGLKFLDLDDKTTEALIAATFGNAAVWNQPDTEPGIIRSLWSLFRVFRMLILRPRTSRRKHRRMPYQQDCRLVFPTTSMTGTVEHISITGLSVKIPATVDPVGEQGMLYMGSFALKVRRTWIMPWDGAVMAGFKIESVDKGAARWRELTSSAA